MKENNLIYMKVCNIFTRMASYSWFPFTLVHDHDFARAFDTHPKPIPCIFMRIEFRVVTGLPSVT